MGENLNWIPCWYVVNENNQAVSGGYVSGNNTQSGYADISLKKVAVAIVKGYNWAKNNLSEITERSCYESVPKDPGVNPFNTYRDSEEEQHAAFNEGVHIALIENKGKKIHSSYALDGIKRLYTKQYTI